MYESYMLVRYAEFLKYQRVNTWFGDSLLLSNYWMKQVYLQIFSILVESILKCRKMLETFSLTHISRQWLSQFL